MSRVYETIKAEIGEDQACILIARLGGRRLAIPVDPKPDSVIALAVGHRNACALCRALGGDTVELPSRNALEAERRRDAVMTAIARGKTIDDIAFEQGISQRQVFRIKAEIADLKGGASNETK
jgi:hypothetical protein